MAGAPSSPTLTYVAFFTDCRERGRRHDRGASRLAAVAQVQTYSARRATRRNAGLSPLVIFIARAEALAILYAACEFDLHEAVDVLQHDAVATGLIAEIVQDAVQAIMAKAFRGVR
jgi:hypothetical protein